MMKSKTNRWLVASIFLAICTLLASGAMATPYYFTTSNEFGTWAGAVPPGYGTVSITKESGGIYFEVSANTTYFPPADEVTWDKFYFNFNPGKTLTTSEIISDEPIGTWNVVQNQNVSEFGTFDFGIVGTSLGNNAVNPLNFHIADASLDISDFTFSNDSGWYFAGHLKRFDAIDNTTSTFLAGVNSLDQNTPVPEPGTLLLLGTGIIGLVLGRKKLRLG